MTRFPRTHDDIIYRTSIASHGKKYLTKLLTCVQTEDVAESTRTVHASKNKYIRAANKSAMCCPSWWFYRLHLCTRPRVFVEIKNMKIVVEHTPRHSTMKKETVVNGKHQMSMSWFWSISSKFQHRPTLFRNLKHVCVFVWNWFGSSLSTTVHNKLVPNAGAIVKSPWRRRRTAGLQCAPCLVGNIELLDIVPISIAISSTEHIKRGPVTLTTKNGVLVSTSKTTRWIFLPWKGVDVEAKRIRKSTTRICTASDKQATIRLATARNVDTGIANSHGRMLPRCCKNVPHFWWRKWAWFQIWMEIHCQLLSVEQLNY